MTAPVSERPDAELECLAALFDDPDQVVSDAVDARLAHRGREVLPALMDMYRDETDASRRASVRKRYDRLNARFALADFENYLHRDYQDITEAVGIVTSIIRGIDFDLKEFNSNIAQLSAQMPDVADDSRTAMERTRLFNDCFFHTLGFCVKDITMTDPKYAFIDNVLAGRAGNQMTISFVYFMLARATGLDVYPLSFPGGYIPAYRENGKDLFFVNSFAGGEVFSAHDLKTVLRNFGFDFKDEQFVPRDDNYLITVYLEMLLAGPAAESLASVRPYLDKAIKLTGSDRFLFSEPADEDDW